jgi:hypothetical protein
VDVLREPSEKLCGCPQRTIRIFRFGCRRVVSPGTRGYGLSSLDGNSVMSRPLDCTRPNRLTSADDE